MLRVGLTGGIGSGKSVVASWLSELGALVIDADVLAREVVAPGTPGLAEVVEAFGPDVLLPDGSMDRNRLGQLVFADPAARQRLEEIIHPRVRARAVEIERLAPPDAVIVHDIPLLVETGQADRFDAVVVVDTPESVQVDRLVTQREMAESDARARIAAQVTREQRRAAATYVLDNSGTLEELRSQVERLWRELRKRSVG